MHPLEFHAIVARDLDVQNPMPPARLDELARACGVRDGTRVLDVGSGKGSLLRRWAGRFDIVGTGLEINPRFAADARERAEREGVGQRIAVITGPALEFAAAPQAYDVVACIGAPFAIGSFEEAVAWMRAALRPGGSLLIGDRYLAEPFPPGVSGVLPEVASLGDLSTLHGILEGAGLTVTALLGSSTLDMDRYVSAWWSAAHAWAHEHPGHPERAELLALVRERRERYLAHERRHVGWAVWVGRSAAVDAGARPRAQPTP
jgi:SAM-dependent methyltransferase